MKSLPAYLLFALLAAGPAIAEEAVPEQQAADLSAVEAVEPVQPGTPPPAPATLPSAGEIQPLEPGVAGSIESEPSLSPEQPDAVKKPKGGALDESASEAAKKKEKEKKSRTELAEDELNKRILFRETYLRVLPEAEVQALWDSAQRARTDYEKRAALNLYYKTLYSRMAKLAPSIKKLIDENELTSTHRLLQVRVQPTERPAWLPADAPYTAPSKAAPPNGNGKKGKGKTKASKPAA